MKKIGIMFVGILVTTAMFIGCAQNVSEEVLSIVLSDGDWEMKAKTFAKSEKERKEIEIGPKCELSKEIQFLIIEDLWDSGVEVDYVGTDYYKKHCYYYFNRIIDAEGNERSIRETVNVQSKYDSYYFKYEYYYYDDFYDGTDARYGKKIYVSDYYRSLYKENKEQYKEQYMQLKNQFEEKMDILTYFYDHTTWNEETLNFFIDSNKCRVNSQNIIEKGKVDGILAYFKYKKGDPGIGSDGTYQNSIEGGRRVSGESVINLIYNEIETMNPNNYTIKTNKKRTRYEVEFHTAPSSYFNYETISLTKK